MRISSPYVFNMTSKAQPPQFGHWRDRLLPANRHDKDIHSVMRKDSDGGDGTANIFGSKNDGPANARGGKKKRSPHKQPVEPDKPRKKGDWNV